MFSGAGGLSLGFKQTGRVNIVAAAENNPSARKTYKRNFKVERLYADVSTIDYEELKDTVGQVDIIIGGPPCQGFSNANRQHTNIISMNNRLVKEYVRAICELKPMAFVMENVATLKSQVHRFMVDEEDLNSSRIMNLPLSEDKVEILPSRFMFSGALDFLKNRQDSAPYLWNESFYKMINTLYRYRINREKFERAIERQESKLKGELYEILEFYRQEENPSLICQNDANMAKAILDFMDQGTSFKDTVSAIEGPLYTQRALLRLKELDDNKIHIFDYEEEPKGIVVVVKSYAVNDYIHGILENDPYNYEISEDTLNAIYYGAPQKRERFVLVGIKRNLNVTYAFPSPEFTEKYRTVKDAIYDIRELSPSTSVNSGYFELEPHPNAIGLEKELRGKLLYNHVITKTRDTALERFKALNEGQNFHDLAPELKTTYSNSDRTQKTIYMRLKYDEPCGTVVNVRKSMWIHPEFDRAISIREAARLQTFPDTFIFEGTKDSQYQQVGNAVPPFLSKAIANSLIGSLDQVQEG